MKKKLLTYFVTVILGVTIFAATSFLVWFLITYEIAKYLALMLIVFAFTRYMLYSFAQNIVNYFYKRNK